MNPAEPRQSPAAPAPLPGRRAELELVGRELGRVADGEARFIALVGEAGVGKTRLLRECARRAGMLVLWLRAPPDRLAPEDLVEQWLAPIVRGAPRRLDARDLALAAGAYPRLADLSPVAGPGEQAANPARAQEAIARLLADAAEWRPLLLPIDDLPRLRPETRALIVALAGSLADARVAFLATARLEAGDPLGDRILEPLIERHLLMRIDVRCLDEAGVRELLVQELDPGVAGLVLPWLYAKSRGNALFAVELVRALCGQGILYIDPDAAVWRLRGNLEEVRLPATIAHVLDARRAALPAALAARLPVVALLGPEAPVACLAGALEVEESEVERLLGELERHGVLERQGPGRLLAFSHPLMTEHWGRALAPAERRRLAGRAADLLWRLIEEGRAAAGGTQRGGARQGGRAAATTTAATTAATTATIFSAGSSRTGLEAAGAVELARLLAIAGTAGRAATEALVAVELGRRCLRGRRAREAATWVRRASRRLRGGGVSGTERRWLRGQLELLMGGALYQAGRLPAAEVRLRRAVATPEAADPYYGIKAFTYLGNVLVKTSRAGEARRVLGDGLSAIGARRDPAARVARCELFCRLVWNELDHGERERAAAYLQEAETALGDPPPPDAAFAEANLLNNKGHLLASRGAYRQAVEVFRRLVSLARERSPFGLPGYVNNLAWSLALAGDLPEARRLAAEALRRKRRAEDRFGLALTWLTLGTIESAAADWGAAAASFERALGIARQTGNRLTELFATGGLIGAAEGLDDRQAGDRHWREARRLCREAGPAARDASLEIARTRAAALCRRRQHQPALEVLAAAVPPGFEFANPYEETRIELVRLAGEIGARLEGAGRRRRRGAGVQPALRRRLAAVAAFAEPQELRSELIELARLRLQLHLLGCAGLDPATLLADIDLQLAAMEAAGRRAEIAAELAATELAELPIYVRAFRERAPGAQQSPPPPPPQSAPPAAAAIGNAAATGDQTGAASATLAAPADRIRIHALGRLRILRAGESETVTRADWGSRKARLVLAYLLAEDLEGRGVARDGILEAVWPESEALDLDRTFHVTLTFLRRALGGGARQRAGSRVVLYEDGRYRLDFAAIWCDARAFDEEVRRAAALSREGRASEALRWRRCAFERYQGEFLGYFDDLWLEPRREQFRRRFVELGATLAAAAIDTGVLDEAQEIAERLVSCDPLAEEGHRLLIRSHLAAGRRAAAVRQLARCRELLAEQLGIEVSAETVALLDAGG